MGVFEMVVAIVVIGCVTSSIDNWVKHKAKSEKNRVQDGEIEGLRSEIADLKARMQVMEKLATDNDADLRAAFRKLA
jgi:predicted nucleic acid binding AN1-type Zn finger protein